MEILRCYPGKMRVIERPVASCGKQSVLNHFLGDPGKREYINAENRLPYIDW